MKIAELLEFMVENKDILINFVIDGDFINIQSNEDMDDFIKILDDKFQTWEHKEKEKTGKI